jgi:hypothetical protein
MNPFCMLGCLRTWFTVEKLMGTPDSYVPWGIVESALYVESRLSVVPLHCVLLALRNSLATQKFQRDVALERRHYSLLGFGTFGKRDNIQSPVMWQPGPDLSSLAGGWQTSQD